MTRTCLNNNIGKRCGNKRYVAHKFVGTKAEYVGC